jgi:hypothetical protein
MRETWPVEPRGKLLQDLEAADAESREARLERLEFLLGEFGTPGGMMLIGGIGAAIAIGELRSSFLNGNCMATILCCQTFIEHSLAGGYALSGQDALVEIGFKDLIDRSLADGNLSVELAASLHELREMRNPYIHPRIRPNRESLLDRMVATARELQSKPDRCSRDPIQIMAERDARDAIRIVVDYLRHGCPSWTPSRYKQ